ncbi:hypothetical protein SLA2020_057460 [Shorea laevis]
MKSLGASKLVCYEFRKILLKDQQWQPLFSCSAVTQSRYLNRRSLHFSLHSKTELAKELESDQSLSQSMQYSINEVSITEIDPR